KTLLIARHLLFSLQLLTQCFPRAPPPHSSTYQIKRRDHDAVLLLLLLCEVHQQDPEALSAAPQAKWPAVLGKHFCESALSLSGIVGGAYEGAVLLPYVEMVTRCRRFVNAMGGGVRGGEKEGRDVAAAVVAVVGCRRWTVPVPISVVLYVKRKWEEGGTCVSYHASICFIGCVFCLGSRRGTRVLVAGSGSLLMMFLERSNGCGTLSLKRAAGGSFAGE
ncbi:hypothetical protein CUMW_282410, partial [Citrus unshiu]